MKHYGSSYERNQTDPQRFHCHNNVKPDAAPAGMLAVGTALGGLFDNEITGLTVVERATLTNE